MTAKVKINNKVNRMVTLARRLDRSTTMKDKKILPHAMPIANTAGDVHCKSWHKPTIHTSRARIAMY